VGLPMHPTTGLLPPVTSSTLRDELSASEAPPRTPRLSISFHFAVTCVHGTVHSSAASS
jgi:hypothetical protein